MMKGRDSPPGAVAAAIGVFLAISVGCGAGQQTAALQEKEAQLAQAQEEMARQERQLGELFQQVEQVKAAQEQLQRDLAAAQQQADQLQEEQRQASTELTRVQDSAAALGEVAGLLAVDRLLLVELRKPLPQRRQSALDYWAGIRGLAAQSDSALGVKADQVLRAAPDYFDWLEATFTSQEEQAAMYFLLGAKRYEDLAGEFRNDALLVVIRRLDTVAQLSEGLAR